MPLYTLCQFSRRLHTFEMLQFAFKVFLEADLPNT